MIIYEIAEALAPASDYYALGLLQRSLLTTSEKMLNSRHFDLIRLKLTRDYLVNLYGNYYSDSLQNVATGLIGGRVKEECGEATIAFKIPRVFDQYWNDHGSP